MTGPEFIRSLRAFADKDVPELIRTVHRKITLEALTRLVLRTPVDTGRARANWQVAIGARPQGEVQFPSRAHHLFTEPPSEPPPLSTAGQEAVDQGQKVVEQIPAFAISHVTNNVAYILKLEDGGSRQSPHGMLVLTFEELTEMFR